jgi:hypothetical protein
MAIPPSEPSVHVAEVGTHHLARRRQNEKAVSGNPTADAQGLVELACECASSDCERTVKVPMYVFRRMLEAGNQSLLQAGHHAYEQYRTIISIGLLRIEERAGP